MSGNVFNYFKRNQTSIRSMCYSSLVVAAPSNKKALVFVANGSEEMETVICVDVLRRAQSIDVTLCALLEGNSEVKCSRGVRIVPDISFDELLLKHGDEKFDAIVLPGGAEGAKRFCESKQLHSLLRKQWDEQRIIAAVCAAPTALVAAGIGSGLRMTSHPSVATQIQSHTAQYTSTERVVQDGRLLTSQGPGRWFID